MSFDFNKKFAIIGKGFIFEKHAQAIQNIGGEIVDVIDKPNRPDAWKEMVKNTKADCVVILTPNHLHFEMVKFSAENGKIVLCEKPLALKSKEMRILAKYPNIFTLYQLRYHPLVNKIKSEIEEGRKYKIEMNISVHRDEDYWKSWKGTLDRSGGILFNLGIHYFDLLFYLFGESTEASTQLLTGKTGQGVIKGENYLCNWRISTEAPKDAQCRVFKINNVNYDFSSKENLHLYVYQDLLKRKGITPEQALFSVELIEKIYNS